MSFDAGAITGKLVLDINNWTQNVAKVKSDTKSLEGAILRNSAQIRTMGLALTGVGAGITLVNKKLVGLAMVAQESENLFRESMEDMAESATAWSKSLSSALGLNEYEIRKTVGTFNVMIKSMGLAENTAYDMSKALTQLSYDMASFYDLDPSVAFQKLQSGISGEVEPLKRLGIIVNETTIKTWALTNGLIEQGQQLTEQQKIWARFNVIMEATKKAQGDMFRTQNSLTNLVRRFNSQMQQLGVNLGNTLLPALTSFTLGLVKITSAVSDFAQKHQTLTKAIVITTAAFGLLAATAGPIITLLPGLAAAAAAAGTTLGAFAGGLAAKFGLLAGAVTAVVLAFENFDHIKTAFFAFAEGMNNIIAFLIDNLAGLYDMLGKIPLIGDAYQEVADGLRAVSVEVSKNADLMAKKTTESMLKTREASKSTFEEMRVDIALTSEDFGKMIEDMNAGMQSIELESKTPLQEWRDSLKSSFDWAKGTAEMTYSSMKSSFSSIFVDGFNGELKSAEDYFKNFMDSIMRGLADMLAQWISMKLIMGLTGGALGGLPTGGPTPAGSFAEGIDVVPSTGIYKLHAGEKVTPKYDNMNSQGAKEQDLTIYNMITTETVARAMQTKEGSDAIINVINMDSIRNGASKRTIKPRG